MTAGTVAFEMLLSGGKTPGSERLPGGCHQISRMMQHGCAYFVVIGKSNTGHYRSALFDNGFLLPFPGSIPDVGNDCAEYPAYQQ